MSNLTVALIAVGCVIVGIAIAKVAPIFADKKVTDEEKSELKSVVVTTVKECLKLASVKTPQELQDYCVVQVQAQLEALNIKGFSEDEIRLAVAPILTLLLQTPKKD